MWERDTYTNMHTIPNQFHSPQPINAASIHVFLGQVKGAATAVPYLGEENLGVLIAFSCERHVDTLETLGIQTNWRISDFVSRDTA
jgi:hypothetical protein